MQTPAFPCPVSRRGDGVIIQHPELGMSLHDYFAAAALTGILARTRNRLNDRDAAAKMAYEYAEQMIMVREKYYA